MKVSACYIVFNEEQFLPYSLKNMYEFVDEIIIIEGAIKLFWHLANVDGSSKDGTVNIIRNFPDPKKKIKLFQGKWQNKFQMENEYLKHATGDWIHASAGDEIYNPEEIQLLKNHASQSPNAVEIKFPFIHFIWDENHIITCTSPQKGLRDWTSKHQRFFRNMTGLRYRISHSDVEDKNGRLLILYPRDRIHWFPSVHVYHYGYCKSAEDIRQKLTFLCQRDRVHERYGFGSIDDYINAHPYFTRKGDSRTGEVILPYNGKKLGVI